MVTRDYESIYRPSDLGFLPARREELWGGNTPEEASRIFDDVLMNRATRAQHDCVLANASFAIQAIRPQKPIEECIQQARGSLESGRALEAFRRFVELNS